MGFLPSARVAVLAGLEDSDRLDDLVEAACGIAEDYTGRWFGKAAYTETQRLAPGVTSIMLRAYPVAEVSEVVLNGDQVTEFTLDKERGILTLTQPISHADAAVTYTGGYEAGEVPAPVVQAVAMIASALSRTTETGGQTVQSERVGSWSVTYAVPGGTAGLDALSMAAACLLRPYCARM